MVKSFGLGSEPVGGILNPSKKREYRVTNRLQEGKRPLYAVVFNFIDSRYFNVFATVGGNRVLFLVQFSQSFYPCTWKFQSLTLYPLLSLGYYLSLPWRRSYCCIAVLCRWRCMATLYSLPCLPFFCLYHHYEGVVDLNIVIRNFVSFNPFFL